MYAETGAFRPEGDFLQQRRVGVRLVQVADGRFLFKDAVIIPGGNDLQQFLLILQQADRVHATGGIFSFSPDIPDQVFLIQPADRGVDDLAVPYLFQGSQEFFLVCDLFNGGHRLFFVVVQVSLFEKQHMILSPFPGLSAFSFPLFGLWLHYTGFQPGVQRPLPFPIDNSLKRFHY